MRLIKGIKENRRKGLGVSLGPKVQRLRMSHNITRQMKCLELEGSKASKTLQWLHEGFPLTITPLEKHQLDVGGMESRQNGMVPKVSAQICQGAPGCLV